MPRLPHVKWLVVACLLLLPAALYWNTIFHRYGFRDDYSILREALYEPGKVFRICAMQARPIYGFLLEQSFASLDGIDGLKWLRLLAAGLLGVTAAVFYRVLRAQKWDGVSAALLALLITVLPGSQLLVSWTVGWPITLAPLLALAAFACAERAFGAQPRQPDYRWWGPAVLLVTASAFVYQSHSLFYFVPMAAALWPRRRWVLRHTLEWFARHLVVVGLGLGLAFSLMMVAFAQQWVPPSPRVGFDTDIVGKFAWFVTEPLPNALALIVLNDDAGSHAVHRIGLLVGLLLLAGVVREWHTRGWRNGLWWAAALALLVVGSFSVNLLVADRWPGYRVVMPMTAVIAIFATVALMTLVNRRFTRIGLALTVVAGMWLARKQNFELVAQPQGRELALLEQGSLLIKPERQPRVFVITPTNFDRTTEARFRDEFGSLTTDADWMTKEMLTLLLRDRHEQTPDVTERYTFAAGRKLPAGEKFDVVIDLRRLRQYRNGGGPALGLPVVAESQGMQ